jgi:hypothetical protein
LGPVIRRPGGREDSGMRTNLRLLLVAGIAAALAGCGGGDDKVDTKDAQATLRREVGPFTGVLPKHLNHAVTALDCPGEVDKGAVYECGVSLSDGLAGTVRVTPGAANTISWTGTLRHDGATVRSSHAG